MTKQPSLYADIPKLLEQKPFHFGHSQDELDALNERLAGYKGMSKHSLADRVEAKAVGLSILMDFERATPDSLRRMELLGDVPGHEPGRSELEEMLAQNAQVQRNARKANNATREQTALPLNADSVSDGLPQNPETLRERSDAQFDQIRGAIYKRREAVQPMRPTIMKDREVLRGLDPDLYIPFARAFADSVEKDRAHPERMRDLQRLKHINALGSEVQAFLIVYEYAQSIEKFRMKFERKAAEAKQDVGVYWAAHREEVWPHLKNIKQKYNDRMRALSESPTVTAGKEGFSTSLPYKAWTEIEKTLENPEFFVRLKQPRDVLRHLAMEFFVGGEENAKEEHYRAPAYTRSRQSAAEPRKDGTHAEPPERERRHKLLSRIETAYQDDLAMVKELQADHQKRHADAIDAGRRVPPAPFRNPLDAPLHTLLRVYEGRWAALADEVLDQMSTKLLSDPKIHPDAITEGERQQAEIAQRQAQRAQERVERAAAEKAERAARAAQRAADRAAREALKQAERNARAAKREEKQRAREAAEAEAALDSHVGQVMARRHSAKVQRDNTRLGNKRGELAAFYIDGDAQHLRNWVEDEAQRKKDDKGKGGGGRGGSPTH